jgi:hypothetical protein
MNKQEYIAHELTMIRSISIERKEKLKAHFLAKCSALYEEAYKAGREDLRLENNQRAQSRKDAKARHAGEATENE